MKKIKIMTLFSAVLMLLMTGCQLALPEAENKDPRLIGVYVTREHVDLFDHEAYFEENMATLLQGGEVSNADAYQGRLYGEFTPITLEGEEGDVTHEEVRFPGIEGYALFCPTVQDEQGEYVSSQTDAMCEVAFHYGTDTRQEGTLYVLPCDTPFYINPVYQLPDGRVFLVTGQGIQFSGDAFGGEYSTTLTETRTETEDGETLTATEEVKVTLKGVTMPLRHRLLQFDALFTISGYSIVINIIKSCEKDIINNKILTICLFTNFICF